MPRKQVNPAPVRLAHGNRGANDSGFAKAIRKRGPAYGLLHVPPLWRLEVANGFQSSIRRKRIDAAYRDASLADLGKLPIAVDGETDAHVWTTTLWLSDRYGLTIYDASLATLDQELRAAGRWAYRFWEPD